MNTNNASAWTEANQKKNHSSCGRKKTLTIPHTIFCWPRWKRVEWHVDYYKLISCFQTWFRSCIKRHAHPFTYIVVWFSIREIVRSIANSKWSLTKSENNISQRRYILSKCRQVCVYVAHVIALNADQKVPPPMQRTRERAREREG